MKYRFLLSHVMVRTPPSSTKQDSLFIGSIQINMYKKRYVYLRNILQDTILTDHSESGHLFSENSVLKKKKQTTKTDFLSEHLLRVHYKIVQVAKISAGQKVPLISPSFSHLFSGRKEHFVSVLKNGFVDSVFYFEWSRGSQAM